MSNRKVIWSEILGRELRAKNSFLFSLIHSRESTVLGQTFKVKILKDLHVLSSPGSKNYFFGGWSVCMSVCLCVFISITQKLVTAESTTNLATFVSYVDAT